MVNPLSQRRFLVILLLGFASGLPPALIGSTLSFRLAENHITLGAIGLFALVSLPYALKFLWAPVIDQAPLPYFTSAFGRRRGWGLSIQILLAAAIAALGYAAPEVHLLRAALLALTIGILSASQDIVIDALRVEMLPVEDQGVGAATVVLGYRIGMLASGAGALALAGLADWRLAYLFMAALVGVGMAGLLLAPEPEKPWESHAQVKDWIQHAVLAPLRDLMKQPRWPAIAAFIVFYKFGAVVTLAMTSPLYVALGFNKMEVAGITKLFGIAATIAGGFAGGLIVKQAGTWRGLLVGAILQTLAQLTFWLLSTGGHNRGLLMLAIGAENFTGAMATAAFVAYLSSLTHRDFTATQYALLSALSGLSLHLFVAPAGYLAADFGWPLYYALTPLAALPGLVLLFVVRPRLRPSAPDPQS